MDFEVIGKIARVEVIASGNSTREINRLNKIYGKGRWRKLKGTVTIRLPDGKLHNAKLHWYEAHGIGKKEFKIKRFL